MNASPTWPEAEAVARLHAGVLERSFVTVRDQLDALAANLVRAHAEGNEDTLVELCNWHPDLAGAATPERRARVKAVELSAADARTTVAREHGFADWEDVEARGCVAFEPRFEAAVDALVTGDAAELQRRLAERPGLVRERSPYGHRATLLHYAGSNGVEIRRQRVPANLPALVEHLVEAGADVHATARFYGGEHTTRELAATSGHPATAGIAHELLATLERLGAGGGA